VSFLADTVSELFGQWLYIDFHTSVNNTPTGKDRFWYNVTVLAVASRLRRMVYFCYTLTKLN
jgi:hypothetical protein